jgi:Mg-chelatase subunit ChlD
MTRKQKIDRPKANKKETQADIVFCIDSTGSMAPCIRKVKSGIRTFADGLQEAANVDFRLRMIAYRDLHDPTAQGDPPWKSTSFTRSVEEFRDGLSEISAEGGGDYRGAESTLDVLYRAIQSDWRAHETHKTIVLLTDDDTHDELHKSTYDKPDNGVRRVIQEFQTLRHAMLFMVAPDYPAYQELEEAMEDANRKIFARFVPRDEERYEGLREVPIESLLEMIGKTVSRTTVKIARQKD